MTTVRALRARARELGITGRSRMRKAELLLAISAAVQGDEGATSPVAGPPPVPSPSDPAPAAIAVRRHPHTGATPLLPPLQLPQLPDRYDTRHLAVLPKTPTSAVVVWSLSPRDVGRAADRVPVLRVICQDGVLHAAPVTTPIGRWFASGLRPDQLVWAEITAGNTVLALSKRVAVPPDGPSRLHHPLVVSIDIDRPLARWPRDLRRGAPSAPPRPPGRATASERAWRRATTASATPAGPDPAFTTGHDRPAALAPIDHDAMTSSLTSSIFHRSEGG